MYFEKQHLFPDPNERDLLLPELKEAVNKVEENTRIAAFNIIYSTSLVMKEASANNKAIVDSAKERLLLDRKDLSRIDPLTKKIEGSFKIFEERIENVIDNCYKQIRGIEKFNRQLLESGDRETIRYTERFLILVINNLKVSMQKINRDVKTSVGLNKKYADHIAGSEKNSRKNF